VIQWKTDETVDPRSGKILSQLLGNHCQLVWLQASIHCAVLDRERDEITAAMLQLMDDSYTL
jgi:esterase/lipase